MNPYLEGRWSDVHTRLIGYVADELGVSLPDDLTARAEEGIAVLDRDSGYRADVAVTEDLDAWKSGRAPNWPGAEGDFLATTPTMIRVPAETERWIEIHNANGCLITVVEILSPTNKGSGRKDYQKKTADLREARVNLVEIDLLRGGQHTVAISEAAYREFHPEVGGDGLVCISHQDDPALPEVYHCPLREKFPTIRVPLRLDDPVVLLDFQALMNRGYQTGRYWKLDYTKEPEAGLGQDDRDWNEALLKAAALRPSE